MENKENQKYLLNNIQKAASSCAAIVVTYHPSPTNIRHLLNLRFHCGLVVVVDNTEFDPVLSDVCSRHLIISVNKANIGLAAALNKGIEMAAKAGFANMVLLDQDTHLPKDFFSDMMNCKLACDHDSSQESIVVPNFKDRNSDTSASFVLLSPWKLKLSSCERFGDRHASFAVIAITSGTLIGYETYRSLGPFREDYFIDFLDHEYCLRAALAGCKITTNCSVSINHAIGQRTVHSFFGLPVKPTHHSALRKYYFARNSVRTATTYLRDFPVYAVLVVSHLVHEFISTVFYEENKLAKLKAIASGIAHGLIRKMGSCDVADLH